MLFCTSNGGCIRLRAALNNNLNVDDTGNTFVGVLNENIKFILTHILQITLLKQYFVVGYKGTSYDSGMFYCQVCITNGSCAGQDITLKIV